MSAEQMRQEFEAWASEGFYGGLASVADTWSTARGMYCDPAHHMAYCAWQASRAALAVELPPAMKAPPYTSYEGGWNDMRGEAEDAIEAAGVKVK